MMCADVVVWAVDEVVEGGVPGDELGTLVLVRGTVVPGGALTAGTLVAVVEVVGLPLGGALAGGELGDAKNRAVTEMSLPA
jgi:hypothetical protein